MGWDGLDTDSRYRAVLSRDARFDGWFVVGVLTTGIYCRPSCPTPVHPKPRNVVFFPTTAAAQRAGLRACKRCAPDATPGSPAWDQRCDLAARAMRLIDDGVVDRCGVRGLAGRLAVSERHLHRVVVRELGATPVQLARARRAQTARILIETTALPFADVAFAAGFASVRQFNDTVREVFARTPTELRHRARRTPQAVDARGEVSLRLAVRAPFDAGGLVAWLRAHAIEGVEEVVGSWGRGTGPGPGTGTGTGTGPGPGTGPVYQRTLRLPGGTAFVTLRPAADHVRADLRLGRAADLGPAVARCRRLLDLDADPVTIAGVLAADPALRPLVEARPGLRVPGAVDGDEAALRAVIGQQISLAAARTFGARLVAVAGTPVELDGRTWTPFPSPAEVAEADLDRIGLTRQRTATLRRVATALADGSVSLDAGADRREVARRLLAIRGIGPWTVDVIAMRALHDPDVVPLGDLALRRAAARAGVGPAVATIAARADGWKPFRSYATHHLWAEAVETAAAAAADAARPPAGAPPGRTAPSAPPGPPPRRTTDPTAGLPTTGASRPRTGAPA